MQVGKESEESFKFESNQDLKCQTQNFILENPLPSNKDILTPIRSKSSDCLNIKNLEIFVNLTNNGLRKNDEIQNFFSRELLQKIDSPSPITCFRIPESLKESPDSFNHNLIRFNTEEIPRQKINFPEFKCNQQSYESSDQIKKIYNDLNGSTNSPYSNNFNFNYIQNERFTNMFNDVAFYQQAFSPSHFTPNYYEEIRSINKSNENFINQLNLNEETQGYNGNFVQSQKRSSNYQSKNKFDEFDLGKNPDRSMIEKSGLINNFEKEDIELKKKEFKEREGDWACYLCKNLNFKFRKTCNRCKMKKETSRKIFNKYLENIAMYSKINESRQQTHFNQIYTNNLGNCTNFNYYPQNNINYPFQSQSNFNHYKSNNISYKHSYN